MVSTFRTSPEFLRRDSKLSKTIYKISKFIFSVGSAPVSAHRGFAWILAKKMPADDETLTFAGTGTTDPLTHLNIFIHYKIIYKLYKNIYKSIYKGVQVL